MNEENGARGGQQYARDHAAQMNKTSIAIETDAGTFTPYGLDFTGSKAAKAILEEIGRTLLSELGSGHVSDGYDGTDIEPTCKNGVPCASLTVLDPRASDLPNNPCRDVHSEAAKPKYGKSAYFWYHHSTADTPDKMTSQQLQQCAASLATWVYAIASLDEILPRKHSSLTQ